MVKGIEQDPRYKSGFRDGQTDHFIGETSLQNGETYSAEYLSGYLDGWNRQVRVAEVYKVQEAI